MKMATNITTTTNDNPNSNGNQNKRLSWLGHLKRLKNLHQNELKWGNAIWKKIFIFLKDYVKIIILQVK